MVKNNTAGSGIEKSKTILSEILKPENQQHIKKALITSITHPPKLTDKEIKKEKLKAFADRLRNFREENNLSKIQMCELSGLLPPNYQRYEAGTQEPGAITAIQLAAIMDTSVDALFDLENNESLIASQCEAWFNKIGFETIYNGDDKITVLIDDLAPYAVTVNEACSIIKQANQNITPTFRAITLEAMIKLQNKKALLENKNLAGTLKPTKEWNKNKNCVPRETVKRSFIFYQKKEKAALSPRKRSNNAASEVFTDRKQRGR